MNSKELEPRLNQLSKELYETLIDLGNCDDALSIEQRTSLMLTGFLSVVTTISQGLTESMEEFLNSMKKGYTIDNEKWR